MEWFLVWLIVNALFFVWRILVTTKVESRDQSVLGEGAGQPGFSTSHRRRPRP